MILSTKKAFSIFIIIFTFSGFLLGYCIHSFLSQQFLRGASPTLLLLYNPSYELMFLRKHISSTNDLIRVNSYYALFEYQKFDDELLIERFRHENSLFVKRILVWMMSFSTNKLNIEKFLTDNYSASIPGIKIEILRSLKRLDPVVFRTFVKDKSIDSSILKLVP